MKHGKAKGNNAFRLILSVDNSLSLNDKTAAAECYDCH